ncbi:MAG: helix-turn-helix domain-containing protein [Treponema sp.]|nr:helix-turn-helix domain-containing protein [Treponema sp.]
MMRVLVIEDEPIVRRDLVLTTPWEELGCVCIGGAEDSKQALELIKEQKPEIIITDIRMPGLSGLDLIEIVAEMCAVSEDGYFCECIILSGYSDFEYARQAMRSGVQEYLVKPVDDEELANAIRRAKQRIETHKNDDTLKRKLSDSTESMLMLFKEYQLGERKSPNARYVEQAIELIASSYIGGITIESAAEKMSISASYLSRIFKQETGYTFVDYLTYYRIKRATELLRSPATKIYEVADLVGYTDARYFSQIFRKLTGVTPKEFRDSQKL